MFEITAVTHRDRPIYHAINGYGRETIMLRKYVLEAKPAQGAASRGADRDRRRDDGGRTAPFPRRGAGEEGRRRRTTACSATPSSPPFGALKDLDLVIVVDEDIDIRDPARRGIRAGDPDGGVARPHGHARPRAATNISASVR